ncbi:MAG: hypothetical protein ACAI37_14935 [Chthoniobacter sp.]
MEAAPKTPTPQKADPSAFLHPKSFVPRGAPGLTPAQRPPASGISSNKPVERRSPVSGTPPAADEIVLTLGDVLSRIPAPYLKPGNHDAKRELRFKINDLSSDIARGRAAVPLSRIAQLVPDIFTKEIGREEETEIRLPLQKLVEQIGLLRSRPKAPVVEKSTRAVTTAELPPGTKPVVAIEVTKEPLTAPSVGPVPAANTPTLEPVTPAAKLPPQNLPIILSEPVVAPKTVELKATAEPIASAASVILGPPRTGEAPPAPVTPAPVAPPVVPVAPVAPTAVAPASSVVEVPASVPAPPPVASVPELPVLQVKLAAEPVAPAPEPSPIPPASAVPPVTAAEPSPAQKIVIDWGSQLSPEKEEGKGSKEQEPAIQEAVTEAKPIEPAAADGLKLAPVESPDIEPDEEKIHLSLAAILRQCPREILVGEMPHVDDSVRITLPFAPIDRQLVKGQVEVSALRFIVALPEVYQKFFVAKVGVKVPIPLEEVFQNLPAPKQELTPQPPTPPPVVLAPAASTPAPEPATKVVPATEEPAPSLATTAPISEPVPPIAAVVAAKAAEPASPPAEPPPLPVFTPVEAPQAEAPAAPAPAEEEQPAASITLAEPSTELPLPVIPPMIDAPEAATAEKVALPPLPTPVEVAASAIEPVPIPPVAASAITEAAQGAPAGFVPPWLSVEPAVAAAQDAPVAETPLVEMPAVPVVAASDVPPISFAPAPEEAQPEAPAEELVPPPLTITSSEVNAAPSEDAPKLKLQRPFFRPHFVPPPPIFGFTPPPAEPEPEPLSKPEPPSVLAGLTEAAARPPESAPSAETAASELPAETVPVGQPTAAEDESAFAAASPLAASGELSSTVGISPEPIEEKKPEAASDPEHSAELISLAGEHDAPDIAHFSDEPVPFADLAETLAHETTYASELAEVVHVDLPAPEPARVRALDPAETAAEPLPVAEQPAEAAKIEEAAEHRAVTIGEGLAAAAVAATIAEHVPLDFRDVTAPAEELKTPDEAAAPVETSTAEVDVTAEEPQSDAIVGEEKAPDVVEESVPPEVTEEGNALEATVESKAVEPPAETANPTDGKIEEAPAASKEAVEIPAESPVSVPSAFITPEPPAAAVPPPLPHPLFPLPKFPSEPAHVEVLPPPSLPLRRFEQDAIQALFMTEETLDLPKISRLAAALPGVYACVIATRDQACTGGILPEGFDLAALLGLAPRVGEAAGRMPIGQLKHFTLYGDAYSVSFFERNGLSLCAVHRPRSFVPGVREKLVALADELSR